MHVHEKMFVDSFILEIKCQVKIEALNLATIPFDKGYSPLFDDNLVCFLDCRGVHLLLDHFARNIKYIVNNIYIYIIIFKLTYFVI